MSELNQLFRLLGSMFKRVTTAVSMPFRMLMVRVQKMFNVNIISAKLIKPLTGNVKKLFKFKTGDKKDYYTIFGLWVSKKLVGLIVLAACAFVFIYFSTVAAKVPDAPQTLTAIKTDVTFDYDDIKLREYSGMANIRDFDGNIVFTGEIDGGEANGYGTLYTRDGHLLYEGEFANNLYSGAGIRYYADGQKEYEGQFADNQFSGEGRLYTAGGELLYEGLFKAGKYDGEGKLWGGGGILAYEGQFSVGLRQGVGKQYFADGKLNYEGEFYEDRFQGQGTLYAHSGQALYTGRMYAGNIDYVALLNVTLGEALEAFAETPVLFYQNDNNACYLFEKAGVVLTTDCRVRVYEWQRETGGETGGQWYLPGEEGMVQSAVPALLKAPPAASAAELAPTAGYGAGAGYSSGTGQPSSAASSSSSEAPSSSSSEAPASSSSQAPPGPDFSDMPEFVENQKQLYFEIDKGVWDSDESSYGGKVFIKSVTVLADGYLPPEEAEAVYDNPPPSIEDCIAVDTLRRTMPTAFPGVHFEMDKRNKLFQRVWNINNADIIDRSTSIMGDVIYRVNYFDSAMETPAYVTITH